MYYLEKYELFPFISGHISNDARQRHVIAKEAFPEQSVR